MHINVLCKLKPHPLLILTSTMAYSRSQIFGDRIWYVTVTLPLGGTVVDMVAALRCAGRIVNSVTDQNQAGRPDGSVSPINVLYSVTFVLIPLRTSTGQTEEKVVCSC